MNTLNVMLELIKAGLFDSDVSEDVINALGDDALMKGLHKLSSKQDLAHLLGYAMEKLNLLNNKTEWGKEFAQAQFTAVYRYEKIKFELDRILSLFEREKINCILLKGSYLRRFYPEEWLRTSCDIDIFIHKEDSGRAIALLTEECGYNYKGMNLHDYQLYAPSGMHLELHYELVEEGRVIKAEKVLEDVWDYVLPLDDYRHVYRMNNDMFYYYHIVHLAKHLTTGGCGIKLIVDTLVINKSFEFGQEKERLLEAGKLTKAATIIEKLSRVWFEQEQSNEKTDRLAKYIIYGGVYGNIKNRVAANKQKKGGTFGYAVSRIFMSYKYMVQKYPDLEGRKWMFPLYQFRRWYDLLFKGSARSSLNELKINQMLSDEEVNETNVMLSDLGLK